MKSDFTGYRTVLVCAFSAIAAVFSSCATAPAFNPSKPLVSIAQASASDISGYGLTFTTNPYMEPRTLIRGKLNEFFVAKISFNLPAAAEIHIIASMKTADGKQAAQVMPTEDFKAYWYANTSYDPDNDAQIQMRYTNIERSCVPSLIFKQGEGQTSLLLPFVGPNPIQRPSDVYIQVSAGKGEPAVYHYTLK